MDCRRAPFLGPGLGRSLMHTVLRSFVCVCVRVCALCVGFVFGHLFLLTALISPHSASAMSELKSKTLPLHHAVTLYVPQMLLPFPNYPITLYFT